ncbi:EAL domain-containing protein [Paracidovorax valerianellae]|uniref:PAS domain S-box-containing protein/diguanylate cyclase (GGDEF) domain-containing protein n=1 Tax=Paracidovorax valerianellae TaxID=187868 RepID=A0A1G6I217_9BURK|nr:EAL domain-containing protein [Paracidovorax valerianellae]MDA8448027.1 EAL domain-containing protein [Paracidovorax valerianellae]SDC00458.1 PAS domain S-box-containing protein/diguanylate cyclase (GGDEF) domain-containing protein [Paracidovorax valerianellae]
MGHEIFLLGGVHLLLIAVLALLPGAELLQPSRRTRVRAGLAGGVAAVLIMVFTRAFDPANAALPHPTIAAVCTLMFGPVAGAICAALTALGFWLLAAGPLPTGLGVIGTVFAVSLFWRTVRVRTGLNLWVVIVALAASLPPCMLFWREGPAAFLPAGDLQGLLAWLQQMPWRYFTGFLILGGGTQLLCSRAHSLETLRRQEQELLMALDATGGGRWEWDVPQRRFSYRGSFYQAFGLEGRESARNGTPARHASDWQLWNERRHPDDAARLASYLQRAMEGHEDSFKAEFRMLDIHGNWRWLIARGQVAERDANGRPLRLVGMDLDVTSLHELQEALRLSEIKYTTIYQMLPDPAGVTRLADGCYLDVNQAFTELLGYTRDEVVGRTSLSLDIWAHPEQRDEMVALYRRDGFVENLPMVAQRGHQHIPGLMSVRPVTISGEECIVFVFHDMTAEERSRNQLLGANRLLQQAGRLARLGAWEHIVGQGLAYWSDVSFDIHGLPPDAPLPQDYAERFVLPEFREPLRECFIRCLTDRAEWSLEMQIVRADDGRRAWVRASAEPVIEAGEVVRVRGVIQDIDESKRATERLSQSEDRFDRVFRLMPYPMGLSRREDGAYIDVNPAWEAMLGIPRSEAIGRTSVELGIVTQEEREAMLESVQNRTAVNGVELTMHSRHDGSRTVLQSMHATEIDGVPAWLFSGHDITERKRMEDQVREREALLSLTISAASIGLWDWNLQTGLLTGDSRWRDLQGLPAELTDASPVHWTTGMAPADIEAVTAELGRHTTHPATPFDATWQIALPQGPGRWVRNLGKIVNHNEAGRPQRMLGVGIDVSSQRVQEELLQKLAHFDALTGLPNRVLLATRLQQVMARARERGQLLGVAYLDLDGFKPVNDRLGHDAGDRLLVIVAGRLTRALRPVDCVARLGGDEFVILLPDLATRADGERLLRRVMESVAAPYTLGAERAAVTVTASVGYTLYPDDDADADALLRHADQAMYAAKQSGRNRFHAFDAAQERALQSHREQGEKVRDAIAAGEFALFLQPKVDMRQGTVVGAEALARWHHPQRGTLAPGAFLHLMDGTELEIQFGEWVVDAALDCIAALLHAGLRLPVSVNISAQHLQQDGFADWLAQRLARRPDVPPALLDMEITESAALYDIGHVALQLQQLRDLGVTVSLDDFGTGYSSLSYLRRLPMDTLKLDQSFVHGMMTDSGDLAIVQGVIGLASSFGYSIVAEGVETVEQGQMLLQMGCALAQGYCIARPMPSGELPQWLAQWQAPEGWQARRGL